MFHLWHISRKQKILHTSHPSVFLFFLLHSQPWQAYQKRLSLKEPAHPPWGRGRIAAQIIMGAGLSIEHHWRLSNLLLRRGCPLWLEYKIISLTCASREVQRKYFCSAFLPSSPFLCPFPLIVPFHSLLIMLLSIIKIFIVKHKHWSKVNRHL